MIQEQKHLQLKALQVGQRQTVVDAEILEMLKHVGMGHTNRSHERMHQQHNPVHVDR